MGVARTVRRERAGGKRVKQVTAYKCDYCGRCFLRPCNAVQHESSCNANPARKNCKTCVHGCIGIIKVEKPVTYNYDIRTCRDVPDYNFYGAYCDYHNIPIHEKPYDIECETSVPYYNPNSEETPDPGTCWNYEYKGKHGWTQKNAPTGAESEGHR